MRKYLIVIVDDDLDDREIFEAALADNYDNIAVKSFSCGSDFLDFMEQTSAKPNIIVLDLSMPKINGLEVLEILKRDLKSAQIPVVILSGTKNVPDQETAKELGAVYFLQKPVEIIEYSTIADKIVEKMNKNLV